MFRGQLLNLEQLATAAQIWPSTIGRWRRAGLLTEAWIEAYLKERALKRKALANGIPLKVLRVRMVVHGFSEERAATQPLAKRSPRPKHADHARNENSYAAHGGPAVGVG